MNTTATPNPSLFDRAARVFDGWADAETGARVLRLDVRGEREESAVWQTLYHQCRCFLDGGRRVLLRTVADNVWARLGGTNLGLLDLTTGEKTNPFPPGDDVIEVCDETDIALLVHRGPAGPAVIWDRRAERVLASLPVPDGWKFAGMCALADGRRAVVGHIRGRPHKEPVHSRVHLLTPGESPRLVVETDRFTCNHFQPCPTDPELFSYDRWPAPRRDVDQVIHIASLDGSLDQPAALDQRAGRPVSMMGVRDHYVWTPDARRIVSYFHPSPDTGPTPVSGDPSSYGADFNHFKFPWILSALDWRTGEDFAAVYPPGRWGCHMAVTPDSRWIISAGGPGFDILYAVEVAALARGWNEHRLCAYPRTVSRGVNNEPFAYPFVLPDGSGVIFCAGWPGPEHGVYLAEWPDRLAAAPASRGSQTSQ